MKIEFLSSSNLSIECSDSGICISQEHPGDGYGTTDIHIEHFRAKEVCELLAKEAKKYNWDSRESSSRETSA